MRRLLVPWLAAALVAVAACGSSLNDEELVRANAEAFSFEEVAGGADARSEVTADVAEVTTSGPEAGPGGFGRPGAATPVGSAGRPDGGAGPGDASALDPAPAGGPPTMPEGDPGGEAPAGSPGGAGETEPGVDSGEALEEVRLGSIGTQTGVIGASMVPLIDGAKAWAADVNRRGGLAGHHVRLLLADDGGDPSRSLALAKRMVEEEEVLAFYAGRGPTTLQAVAPYLEERQVPMIYSHPGNVAVDESPMVFNPTAGAKLGVQWAHLAGLARFSDKRRIALLPCREVATCTQLADGIEELAPRAGMEVVFRSQISLAQPDFTAEVLAARNAGADAVVPVADNPSNIRILRSAHRQGWHPVLSTQQASFEERFLAAGGADVEGSVMGGEVPWLSSQMADYRAALERHVPGAVQGSFGGAAWAGGKLLERVAASFPPDPGPRDVLEGLWGLEEETLGGLLPPLTFAREGGHGLANPCVVAVKVEGQRFVEDDGYSCPPGFEAAGR